MSKRHFIALANIVRAVESWSVGRTAEDVVEMYRRELSAWCKSENNQFNQQRWNDYIDGKCGPSATTGG